MDPILTISTDNISRLFVETPDNEVRLTLDPDALATNADVRAAIHDMVEAALIQLWGE